MADEHETGQVKAITTSARSLFPLCRSGYVIAYCLLIFDHLGGDLILNDTGIWVGRLSSGGSCLVAEGC